MGKHCFFFPKENPSVEKISAEKLSGPKNSGFELFRIFSEMEKHIW
jgi:hypothetical protein